MKSVRLSNAMRDEIIANMSKQWEVQNPSPCNISEEKEKVALKIWEDAYGHIPFKDIPDEFLKTSHEVKIQVGAKVFLKVMSFNTDKPLPCPYPGTNSYRTPICKSYDPKPAFLENLKMLEEKYQKWDSDKRAFVEEIRAIVYSVNSTKQLSDLWPEAIKFVPSYVVNPSTGIKLPALRTEALNEALGETTQENEK